MTEVLLVKPFLPEHLSRFSGFPDCRFTLNPAPTQEELSRAEVIMGVPSPDLLKKAENARLFQCTNAGVDPYIKRPDLFEKGLVLCNLSGAFGTSIAEFVLCYVLMLYKHLPLYRDNQARHIWQDWGRQESPLGKQVLILGAGDIGQKCARLFAAFSCHITGMRRHAAPADGLFEKIIAMEGLDEALQTADIVICALPDTIQTHKMLDKRRLCLMKRDALLINVGRGGLVDCDALAEILHNHQIRGAALDVTDPEPLPENHPLWDCENLILTPHITGGSIGHLTQTEDTLFDICRQNLQRYLTGQPLLNRVDLQNGTRKAEDRYIAP